MDSFEDIIQLNKKRMGLQGLTIKDKIQNTLIRNFETSPAYSKVELLDGTLIGVHIIDDTNFKSGRIMKYLIRKPPENVKTGEYYVHNNTTYLITESDNLGEIYDKGLMQKCNNTLSWTDEYGKPFNYPCIVASQTLYSVGMDIEEISVGNEKIEVMVTRNDDTLSISRDRRFKFDGTVYEVTYIDSITQPGILNLKMQEYSSDNINDNNTWVIELPQTITELEVGNSIQLTANAYKNSILQENEQVLWTVSDDTIASIDTNGNLTADDLGNITVTCSLVNNTDIKQSITIDIIDTPAEPTVSYELQGDSSLHWTENKTYNAIKYIDGVEDTSVTCSFDITSDTNSVAKIVSTTDTSCDITYEQMAKGIFTLTATCSDGKVLTKDIEMLGF